LALFLVAVAVLILHAAHYWPFLSDDALISLRYARRLLDGHGLTWTDGPRVEGYSNLLWVLLVALAGALGMDLIDAARLLGVAGMAAVVAVALSRRSRATTTTDRVALAAGILFFVLAAPTAVWAIGGLEQPLVAALLASAIVLSFSIFEAQEAPTRRLLALSLALGLLCVTRPDGPLFTVATMLAFAVWTRDARRLTPHRAPTTARLLATIVLFPALLFAAQLAFRLLYYRDWVSNPARVKIGPSLHRVAEGAVYLAKTFVTLAPLSFVALAAGLVMLRRPERRPHAILLASIALLWSAYLLVVGGDTFPSGRQFVPIVVVLTFALIEGGGGVIEWIARRVPAIRSPALATILVIVTFGVFVAFQHRFNHRAREERWEWDGQALALTLKRAFADEKPLIAVTAAGCLPYWTGFPAVDMLGLNDAYLPRHRPPGMGEGPMGHELGSGRYVLDRQPDLIVFHTGLLVGDYRSDLELARSEQFHREYTPVTITCGAPHRFDGVVWFRNDSPKVGIRATKDSIVVPAYLMRLEGATSIAVLGRENRLVTRTVRGGRWSCVLPEPVDPAARVVIQSEYRDAADWIMASVTGRILEVSFQAPMEVESFVVKR
jgi:hypothetical protein